MGRRDFDLNRERLVFCLTSLVGHRVTTKLRNNIIYEGLFHSCSLDGDFSITLKCARLLPSESCRSGEVINTLVIPGKDFLQVSAVDVPSPGMDADNMGGGCSGGFAIDAEIAQKKAPKMFERELVPWAGDSASQALEDCEGGLESAQGRDGHWDQFGTNADLYGVTSTYHEELYTTPLDPSSIPKEKREEAERIAREIESGQMASEVDGRIEAQDQDGDEENAFSSVQGRSRKALMSLSDLPPSSSGSVPAPVPVPLTREHLSQHDRDNLAVMAGEGFAREHRAKRGMITAHSAHSPMRSPMISEMKRINALNLEPALPKLDDKTRNDWINFKQNRPASKSVQGNGLKHEFQQALDNITKREAQREATKQRDQDAPGGTATGSDHGADAVGRRGMGKGTSSDAVGSGQGSMLLFPRGKGDMAASGGDNRKGSGFTFNPGAKEFSFNPQAATFTPSNAGGAPSPSGASGTVSPQAKASSGPSPQFQTNTGNTDLLRRNLGDILDAFFERAKGESTEHTTPDWPEACGNSFHEVLGQPSPNNPMPTVGAIAAPVGGSMPSPWQQAPNPLPPGAGAQAQMTPGPGGPTQMGPHGFMVATGNAPGGQQPQMYPQMFPATSGGVPGRPQNGTNMPPQQQPMVFNQQAMMAQQQPGAGSMAIPAGMVGSTQVVPTMVMPGGQYGPQGFVPQQAGQGQGQPGPPGPQGGGPQHPGQQGQMIQQQGQMGMQPGWGQPPGDGRRMGGGGPPGHGPMGGGMEG